MGSIKNFIERHSSLILTAGFVIGLAFPQLAAVPDRAVPWMLAIVIFCSCARISSEDLRRIDLKHSLGFYLARFIVLPLIVGGVLTFLFPRIRDGVLLLCLAPAGSSLPAWNAIMGGNVALGMGLLVLSSLLAPFIIPAAFSFVDVAGIELDLAGIFLTLAGMIFAPVAVYFLLARHVTPVKSWLRENGSVPALLFLAAILTLVIAKQRDYFFTEPLFLIGISALACAFYFAFYAFGWLAGARQDRSTRITYELCSGTNNLALAISIGFLYFPDPVSHFLILNEIAWLAGIAGFQKFTQKTQ